MGGDKRRERGIFDVGEKAVVGKDGSTDHLEFVVERRQGVVRTEKDVFM